MWDEIERYARGIANWSPRLNMDVKTKWTKIASAEVTKWIKSSSDPIGL